MTPALPPHASVPSSAPPPSLSPTGINVTLGADGLLALGGLVWLIWSRVIRSKVVTKLDGFFTPFEEERRLNNLLAQVGAVSQASRVVLAAFHNGSIDNYGYHLLKLSTINTYIAPGGSPMVVPIRDLPVERIRLELEQLLDANNGTWCDIVYDLNLPEPCRDHLRKNNIELMHNRLVRIGTLPIGIISLQYAVNDNRIPSIKHEPYANIIDKLYDEIASIMRRRVVHPGLIRRLLMQIRSSNSPMRP
jgi:hypothetical protein